MTNIYRFNDATEEIHKLSYDSMHNEQYEFFGTYYQYDISVSDSDNDKVSKIANCE